MLVWKFLYMFMMFKSIYSICIILEWNWCFICYICTLILWKLANVFQTNFTRVYSCQNSRFVLASNLIYIFLQFTMLNNTHVHVLICHSYLLVSNCVYFVLSLAYKSSLKYFVNTFCHFVVCFFIFATVFFEEQKF